MLPLHLTDVGQLTNHLYLKKYYINSIPHYIQIVVNIALTMKVDHWESELKAFEIKKKMKIYFQCMY